MDKVKVHHDQKGNTLTVWFDNPAMEHVCTEVDDDIVLIKDKQGRVVGVECLNYLADPQSASDECIEVQTL